MNNFFGKEYYVNNYSESTLPDSIVSSIIEYGKFAKIYAMVCSYQNLLLVLKTITFEVNDQIEPNETKDAKYTTQRILGKPKYKYFQLYTLQ